MARLHLAFTFLVALLTPAAAHAGAGGGSGGYGGGGGGGGFSGGGGGSGGAGGTVDAVVIVAILALGLLVIAAGMVSTWRYRKRRRARLAQTARAAAEAAEDDPVFAPDAVGRAAADLYLAAQDAWDRRDRERLAELVGGELLVEWHRRLGDFDAKGWHNVVKVHGRPEVEYLGLVNRPSDDEDRVVVRIRAQQDDYVEQPGGGRVFKDGATGATVVAEEWWTLARRDGSWIVVSIESDAEGRHHLDSEIIAAPEHDHRVRDEATVELAQADAAPAGVRTAEIADLDFDGDARAAALDLALADARFAPDVLEVAVRRAVAGWAEAVDGPDEALLAVAAPGVVGHLLHPGDPSGRTRLVVRGPRVQRLRIAGLDAAVQPPRMTVEVDVAGRRYIEDRDTADVISGSREGETRFTEEWTLSLDGPPENPWRITGA